MRAYVTQFVTAQPTSVKPNGQHVTYVLTHVATNAKPYMVLEQRGNYRSSTDPQGSHTKEGTPSTVREFRNLVDARNSYEAAIKAGSRAFIQGSTTKKFADYRAMYDLIDITPTPAFASSTRFTGKNIIEAVQNVLNTEQPKQGKIVTQNLTAGSRVLAARLTGAGAVTIGGLSAKERAANRKTAAATKPKKPADTRQYFTEVEKKVVRPNGEQYFPREVMGHTDVSLLRKFRSKNIHVRLAGAPGTGKTALVEAAFNDAITMSGHGDMTVAHFVGTYLPKPDGAWGWADGPLIRAMREGKPLFVDEGTRIPTEVLNILFSVMDGRNVLRIDDRPDLPVVHGLEGFYVIMGYNPDTLGARPLDEALTSRFRVQVNVTTDYTTAKRIGVPDLAIRIAENLNTRDKQDRTNEGPGVWVPQMRELITFRDLLELGAGEEFALSTMLAACPRSVDIPAVQAAIKDVAKKTITLPTLGRSV